MEDETKTQLNVSYKKKNIRVLLEFSEEQGNENAEEFYSRLKKYYMEKLRHQEKEIILLLLLDNKLNLIEEYMVSMGTARASLLSSREVFIEALKCRACYLMLMHNHPSGDPHPSSQDIAVTRKIKEAGELMDIPLIDHIILGDNCYMSLKEEDLL